MKINCIGKSNMNIFIDNKITWTFNIVSNITEYLNHLYKFDKNDYVMLIAGEEDCRFSILNHSKLENRNINDIVKERVDNLFNFYIDLKEKGYKVIGWGGQSNTLIGHSDNPSYPIYGNCLVRNRVSKLWDLYMKEKCDQYDIPFISILKYLIKSDGLSDSQYFMDYVHLKSELVLPFVYKELQELDILPKEIVFTFGIVTTGNSDDRILQTIESIKALKIPNYEIIIVGNSKIQDNMVKVIPFDETIKRGWITKKKNLITQNAKYENIVYSHDYFIYDKDWYNGWLKYGDNFHLCMNVLQNQDRSRYRDWTLKPNTFPVDIGNSLLLPYNETRFQKYMYFSGAYWVAKKSIMQEFPLNENLCWGDADDFEWATRYLTKYNYSMNSHSKTILLKHTDPIFIEMSSDMYQYIVLPVLSSNVNLVKGPEGWDTFTLYCKEIVDNNINSFKQNSRFNYMTDHLTIEQASKYIQKHNSFFSKIDWRRMEEIDAFGNPQTINFGFANVSPSIFRYIGLAIDILSNCKLLKINIVEIGGVYGCQCKIIYELAPLFGIDIIKYTILDFEYCNLLQRKFVSVECKKITDYIVEPIDYVISNYYLASIPPEYKYLYFPVVEQAKHGFFIWNTNHKVPECITNKKCYIADELPQTGILNKCITF